MITRFTLIYFLLILYSQTAYLFEKSQRSRLGKYLTYPVLQKNVTYVL